MGYSRPKNLIKRTHIDAPREGRKGYSDRAVNEVSMFLDAPREGRIG